MICVNCWKEVEAAYVHKGTVQVYCDPYDLKKAGMRDDEGYVACPTPPNED